MSKPARGRLYVDKDVQRALLWQLLRHWALFLSFLTGMVFVLQALEAGPGDSWTAIWQQTWNRHAPLFVAMLALFPVFVYDSIKLSNRFVGPILRLRRTLSDAAAGGTIVPLKFRDGDFWQDIAANFNALLERFPVSQTDDYSPPVDAKSPPRAETESKPISVSA